MKGTAGVVRSQTLKSFLGTRKGTGIVQTKTKKDQLPVTSTLKKNAAVDAAIAERLRRATEAARCKSTASVASSDPNVRVSKTPEQPVRRSPSSQHSRAEDEAGQGEDGHLTNPSCSKTGNGKRTFVDVVDTNGAASTPSSTDTPSSRSSLRESNKTTRRRLFRDAPVPSLDSACAAQDPVSQALASQRTKQTTRAASATKAGALRSKYAHLLEQEDGNSSSARDGSERQVDGSTRGKTKPRALRDKYAHLITSPVVSKTPEDGGDAGPSGTIDEKEARFRYLLNKDKTSLRLPFKYQVLLAKFLALETTLMIQQHCRGRTVTFESARPSVERTCSKAFTMDDLARIMTVYPDAYNLAVIHRNGMSPQGTRGTVDGYYNGRSTVRIFADFGNEQELDECMRVRKEVFTEGLLEIAKAGHQVFLNQLSPRVTIGDEEIMQWHPDFKDNQIPDIKRARLPEGRKEHVPSAAEILNRRNNMSPTVKRALEHVVAKQSIPDSPVKKRRQETQGQLEQESETAKNVNEESQLPTTGAPLTLLERIKLKERLNKERKMRNEHEANGLSKFKKMWECAVIIRALARSKRKTALLFTECVTAVTRCMKTPMAEARIKNCLVELAKAVPAWCQVKKVQDKFYFTMTPAHFDVLKTYFAERDAM